MFGKNISAAFSSRRRDVVAVASLHTNRWVVAVTAALATLGVVGLAYGLLVRRRASRATSARASSVAGRGGVAAEPTTQPSSAEPGASTTSSHDALDVESDALDLLSDVQLSGWSGLLRALTASRRARRALLAAAGVAAALVGASASCCAAALLTTAHEVAPFPAVRGVGAWQAVGAIAGVECLAIAATLAAIAWPHGRGRRVGAGAGAGVGVAAALVLLGTALLLGASATNPSGA